VQGKACTTLRPSVGLPRLLSVLLAALAVVVAGCGGGGEDDVARILDRAFKRPIDSANVNFDATVRVRGAPQLERPIRIQASGPFRSEGRRPPQFAIDLKMGVEGGGASIDTGRVAVGDRAWVKFQDSYYEVPRREVERANREFRGERADRSKVGGLQVNPRSWIENASDEGEEEIAGVETRHLTGQLNMRNVITDLNRFVARAGRTLGAGAAVPRPLPPAVLDKFAQVVRNPSFDVYVGKDDDRIRRLSTNLQVNVPEADRRQVQGIEGGALELTIEFRDVGEPQNIPVPAQSRPLSDLTKQLGGAGALGLGALGGGQGGASPGGTGGAGAQPAPGGASPTAPQPQGGGASPSDAEAFQRYADCLKRADPNDTAALQRCSEQLQR